MSALGHKRTYAVQKGMSAFPPKATLIATRDDHVPHCPTAPAARATWGGAAWPFKRSAALTTVRILDRMRTVHVIEGLITWQKHASNSFPRQE